MLRQKLLRAVCAALLVAAAPGPNGFCKAARAALVIHGPDGRPLAPMGFGLAERLPVILPADEAARAALLSEEDAARYRRIFEHQDRGEWGAADAEIRQLTDKRLLGHVLRQRLLHPDRKASYDELNDWLHRYSDHPGADRIHALALRRQPSGARSPKAPQHDDEQLTGSLERLAGARPLTDEGDEGENENLSVAPRSRTSSRHRADMAAISHFNDLLRGGKTGTALKLLGDDEVSRQLDPVQYDTARARIAAALYYEGEVSQALSLASASAARSGDVVTQAHWIAGLAAWRLKQYDRASRHFDALVAARPRSPWTVAAGAYWAARAHAKKGRHDDARTRLVSAARYPHTFYGLIAGRTLGQDPALNWQLPELTGQHLAALAEKPTGARAVALLQVGQKETAEHELKRVHPRGNDLVEQALVVLADRAGLAGLALRVGNAVTAPDGAPYDASLFPLPHWQPRTGFTVDRALVFAVMRQESRFDPRMVSSAGATGLMQIIPSTAEHVVGRHDDLADQDTGRPALFDPANNMELGQRYLAELMTTPEVNSNLILLAAAYNAGPGTLSKWRRERGLDSIDDPLLFVESLPYAETRDYVGKVLANFWIYRLRLGQETGSLDAVAAGAWPVYMPVDTRPTQVAQHAQD
ncbi:MAG TPA: lytic transglycosylase domain-containing protein [Azospirillum sp.]|nr:lytic transglycosylase domain-containing protein [Azospirillum sp.]